MAKRVGTSTDVVDEVVDSITRHNPTFIDRDNHDSGYDPDANPTNAHLVPRD